MNETRHRANGEVIEETDRLAGCATPRDADLRREMARGLGVDEDDVAAVYTVFSRLTVFLLKATMIARGDTDEYPQRAPGGPVGQARP